MQQKQNILPYIRSHPLSHLVWPPPLEGRSEEPSIFPHHKGLQSWPLLQTAGNQGSRNLRHSRKGHASDPAHRTCNVRGMVRVWWKADWAAKHTEHTHRSGWPYEIKDLDRWTKWRDEQMEKVVNKRKKKKQTNKKTSYVLLQDILLLQHCRAKTVYIPGWREGQKPYWSISWCIQANLFCSRNWILTEIKTISFSVVPILSANKSNRTNKTRRNGSPLTFTWFKKTFHLEPLYNLRALTSFRFLSFYYC